MEDISDYILSYVYDEKSTDILAQLQELIRNRGEYLYSQGIPENTDEYYQHFVSEDARLKSLMIPIKIVFTKRI